MSKNKNKLPPEEVLKKLKEGTLTEDELQKINLKDFAEKIYVIPYFYITDEHLQQLIKAGEEWVRFEIDDDVVRQVFNIPPDFPTVSAWELAYKIRTLLESKTGKKWTVTPPDIGRPTWIFHYYWRQPAEMG